jgi:hypothetical protein
MSHEAEAASLQPEQLSAALADGYATVHELETRRLQLQRHAEALIANGSDGEQIRAVLRARRALSRELEGLRTRLEAIRATSS